MIVENPCGDGWIVVVFLGSDYTGEYDKLINDDEYHGTE